VGVGSESDPSDFVGFSHLIEHLLFTGSKNYDENHHIEKVVNKYHGEQNGVTQAFTTSYFYQIETEGLKEFLMALVDALKEPLFSEENIKKEVNNVNSEISMRMTFNKNLAYYKLIKAVGNKDAKIFSDGFSNIDTSKIDYKKLREQILAFHEKYYSANIMTLVIITEQDMSDVRKMITPMFESIPNKNVTRPFHNETASYVPPFSPEVLGKAYYLQGFTDPAKFSMIFQVPSGKAKTDFQPLQFFSFILEHFSANSLRETLIRENLASSFSDSIALQDYVKSLYIVTFTLTPGIDLKLDKIVKHFFQFVSHVRKLADKQKLYDVYSKTSKFQFMFNVKNEFINFANIEPDLFERCLDFSETLQDFPPEMIFTLNNVLFKYNEAEFNELLDLLTPSNAIYIAESKEFTTQIKATDVVADVKTTGSQRERVLRLSEFGKIVHDENLLFSLNDFNGRQLAGDDEKVVDEGKDPAPTDEETAGYFAKISNKQLDKEFDFDNKRQYTSIKINPTFLAKIYKEAEASNIKYDVPELITTTHLDHFYINTTCQTPPRLTIEGQAVGSKKLLSQSTEAISIMGNPKVDTEVVFNAIFNGENANLEKEEREKILADLDSYKKCLTDHFENDKLNRQAKRLSEENSMVVYQATYRRTLQPLNVIVVAIESQFAVDITELTSKKQRIIELYKLELFCLYLTRHIKLKFHEFFMKGSSFSCQTVNGRILLHFQALNDILEDFIAQIVSTLPDFTNPEVYQQYILSNLQLQLINEKSQFDSITSLKLAMFYLNKIMDKNFIDNSSNDKLESIMSIIKGITPTSLAYLSKRILQHKKLVVLSVGELPDEKSLTIAKNINGLFENGQADQKQSVEPIDLVRYRNNMINNFSFGFKSETHQVLRLANNDKNESNSVYLSFFKLGRATRELRFASTVMIHYMHKHVFQVLRNQLNLGYVAQAGLRIFYRVI
jgi:secreted Zn-dependent insulinase-like peptidase